MEKWIHTVGPIFSSSSRFLFHSFTSYLQTVGRDLGSDCETGGLLNECGCVCGFGRKSWDLRLAFRLRIGLRPWSFNLGFSTWK